MTRRLLSAAILSFILVEAAQPIEPNGEIPATTKRGNIAEPSGRSIPLLIKPSAQPAASTADELSARMREDDEYMLSRRNNVANQDTVILKLKPGVESRPRALISHEKAKEIGAYIKLELIPIALPGVPDHQVFKLPRKMTEQQISEDICKALIQHPDVENCSENGAVYSRTTPSDPGYSEQWGLKTGPGSANVEKAWDTTKGDTATVIAILDSGITPHQDIDSIRILPGYDFVTDAIVGNDNDGRDANPSDPGNWVSIADTNRRLSPRSEFRRFAVL